MTGHGRDWFARWAAIAMFMAVPVSCGGGDRGPPTDAASATDTAADGTSEAETTDAGVVDAPAADTADDGEAPMFIAAVPCLRVEDYVTGPPSIATVGMTYSPACLRVPAGTVVTIEASGVHPLEPRDVGPDPNPIPALQTDPTAIRFAVPGFYGFRCPEHSDQQMFGVIWVTP